MNCPHHIHSPFAFILPEGRSGPPMFPLSVVILSLSRRSIGTRLTFGYGVSAYMPGQTRATEDGGPAVMESAVALAESNEHVAMGVVQPSTGVPNSLVST